MRKRKARALTVLFSIWSVMLLLMTLSCGDGGPPETSPDEDATDLVGDQRDDGREDPDADVGEGDLIADLDVERDADLPVDVGSGGLVLAGGFVPVQGEASAGGLELRGTFAQGFAPEWSANGDRRLEHVVFGIRWRGNQ